MHKFLGIYTKHGKPFHEEEFSEVIGTIKGLCNPKNDNTYVSENFFFMLYCDKEEELPYFIKDNVLYAYSGYVYFHQYPMSDKNIDIERERFERIIAEEKSGNDNIEGNYNIVRYNLKKNRLSIQSDVLGLNTLFCYEDKNVFMFCSDYEPLVKYNGNKYKIDIDAIYEYMMVMAPQNGRTFFKDISIFPRNKTYYVGPYFSRYKSGKRIRVRYSNLSVTKITENYFNTLKKEVRSMLEWYPNILVCLTGGADTRMILGCMSDIEMERHTFVTIRNRNIEDVDNQDVMIAQKLAEKYKLKHETINYEFLGMASIDNAYFRGLFSLDVTVLSGFCGSATLDLQLSRWVLSELCRNIVVNRKTKHLKDIFCAFNNINIGKYMINNGITLNKLKKEVLSILEKSDVDNKLELYIPIFLYRSFFSCICGGASGNLLMPGIINRHYMSPFVSKNCIYVLCSAKEENLGKGANDIRNLIFKNHLYNLTEIESNADLCNNKDCVLKKTTLPKNQNDFCRVSYENLDHIFDNEYTKSLNIFNLEKIREDYYDNKRDDSHVFIDLLLWLNYVSTI